MQAFARLSAVTDRHHNSEYLDVTHIAWGWCVFPGSASTAVSLSVSSERQSEESRSSEDHREGMSIVEMLVEVQMQAFAFLAPEARPAQHVTQTRSLDNCHFGTIPGRI